MAIISKADWPTEVRGRVPILPRDPRARHQSKAAKAAAKKARRVGNSAAHLALLRMLPCSLCHETRGIHPHHMRSGAAAKERSIGRKATDRRALPLCFAHHVGGGGVHSVGSHREAAWFWDEFGMDAEALTEALWHQTGDLWRLNRILLAHKLAASRVLVGRK